MDLHSIATGIAGLMKQAAMIGIALGFLWFVYRTGSLYLLRRMLQKIFLPNVAARSPQACALKAEEDELRWIQFITGIKFRSIQHYLQLKSWLSQHDEHHSTIARMGGYFDLVRVQPKKPNLFDAVICLALAILILIFVSAFAKIAAEDGLLIRPYDSSPWYAVSPKKTTSIFMIAGIFYEKDKKPRRMSPQTCTSSPAEIEQQTSIPALDAEFICMVYRAEESEGALTKEIKKQRNAFLVVIGALIVAAIPVVVWIRRCSYAFSLQDRLKRRAIALASSAAQPADPKLPGTSNASSGTQPLQRSPDELLEVEL